MISDGLPSSSPMIESLAADMDRGKKGILERLAEGPVIGDGGMVLTLERRGYVQAGIWTPECTVTHPEAVRQLHREFVRAGCHVTQAFTFQGSASSLATAVGGAETINPETVNKAAIEIAREVADEVGNLVSGSLSLTRSYDGGKGKQIVQEEYRQQMKLLVQHGVDFIICEYMLTIELMEWAIEVAKESGLPVASTMAIGPAGDLQGVPVSECAVRMARAGSDIVGINCSFDPETGLRTMGKVKTALMDAGLQRYLILQPAGILTPEVDSGVGYMRLAEAPFAFDPRIITRFEVKKYARKAYEMGINYIGGCCGFEPFHIRALAEELATETGKIPEVTRDYGFLTEPLKNSYFEDVKLRDDEYWYNLQPSTGRPLSAAFSKLQPLSG